MFKNVFIIFLFLLNFSALGEENLLTLKQQLDRLQREVNDLSKLTFQRDDITLSSSIYSHPQVTQDTRLLFSYFIYFKFDLC